jgi:hypothetical protein
MLITMSKKKDFVQTNTIFTKGLYLSKLNSRIVIETLPCRMYYARDITREKL